MKDIQDEDAHELGDLTSQGAASQEQIFIFQGQKFKPSSARHWSNEHITGMPRLAKADRIVLVSKTQIRAKKVFSERLTSPLNNWWLDTQFGAFAKEKVYVVQLSTGQKTQNVDILGLPTIKIEQNVPKQVKPCAKDALGFASMLFDWNGLMFHHPFANPMRPAKCQG